MTKPDAQYRKDYARGWRASQGPRHADSLERADERSEVAAWYDGYEDYACGYPRYTAWYERSEANGPKTNTAKGNER